VRGRLVYSLSLSFCLPLVACRSPKATPAEPDASVPAIRIVDSTWDAAPKPREPKDAATPAPHAPIPKDTKPEAFLDLWTTAMAQHDLELLRVLYADNVVWMARDEERATPTTSATELLVRHSREFASGTGPGATLSILRPRFLPDGSGGTYIEFTKVVKEGGQEKSHQASLFVLDGRLVAEADQGESPTVRWNWCAHSIPTANADYLGVPRTRGIGVFTVTPMEAIEFVMESKHLKDLQAKTHAGRLKAVLTGCPQLCENMDPRGPHAQPPCVETSGAYEIAVRETPTGETVEAVEVDAMSAHGLKWH